MHFIQLSLSINLLLFCVGDGEVETNWYEFIVSALVIEWVNSGKIRDLKDKIIEINGCNQWSGTNYWLKSFNIVFVTQSVIKVCTKVFKQVKKKLIKNLGYKYNLQYNIH